MIHDAKVPIIYGFLGAFQDDAKIVSFDGKKWNVDWPKMIVHLKAIRAAGTDGIRFFSGPIWGSHKYGKRSQFQPYLLDEKAGLWDLRYWNDYFFPILGKTIQIINDLNMTAILPWFENCQFHGGYKKWSCWANNIQGIGSFYELKADQYSKNWMFTTHNRYYKKYDIMFPFGNENENQAFPAMAKRVIFPFVKKYSLDPGRLTYGATIKVSTVDSVQDKVRRAFADMFGVQAERRVSLEAHDYPFSSSSAAWGNLPYPKIYSDDGLHPRPSPTAWGFRAKYIVTHYPTSFPGRSRIVSFEHLPDSYPIDTALQVATIKAIKKACEGV